MNKIIQIIAASAAAVCGFLFGEFDGLMYALIAFIDVEKLLEEIPNCREKSIALTHIEDAMLHSNLAITEGFVKE